MRFKTFILSEGRSEGISKKDALDTLRTKCKNTVNSFINDRTSRLFRGLKDTHEFLFVDPKKHTRVSKNTSNYYTHLVDNSPLWKAYPKRSESIICTTNIMGTTQYGDAFAVIPYDGATLAVASTNDFWSSFKGLYMDYFNRSIIQMMYYAGIPISDTSYSGIKKAFKEFENISKDTLSSVRNSTFRSDWLVDYRLGDDLLDYVNNLLNPKKNNMRLTKAGQGLPKLREVWTDSKCILISIQGRDVDGAVDILNEV